MTGQTGEQLRVSEWGKAQSCFRQDMKETPFVTGVIALLRTVRVLCATSTAATTATTSSFSTIYESDSHASYTYLLLPLSATVSSTPWQQIGKDPLTDTACNRSHDVAEVMSFPPPGRHSPFPRLPTSRWRGSKVPRPQPHDVAYLSSSRGKKQAHRYPVPVAPAYRSLLGGGGIQ